MTNTQKGPTRVETSEESQKTQRAKDYVDSAHKHNCGTIVERSLADEQYQQRKHETRILADRYGIFLTEERWKGKNFVATPEARR